MRVFGHTHSYSECLTAYLIVTAYSTLAFQWVQYSHQLDFVAGVALADAPLAVGVFVSRRSLLTAANPLHPHLKNISSIHIHTVNHQYDKSTLRKIQDIAANQAFRKKSWVTVGFDRLHTTIHDLAIINVVESDVIGQHGDAKDRRPYAVKLPRWNSSVSWSEGWFYAEFEKVGENNVLEVTYTERALADCDTWVPREWGRFLCVPGEAHEAVAAGAPLLRARDMRTLMGMGSFTLRRGKESVLVFTDLRPYVDKLYGYIKDGD